MGRWGNSGVNRQYNPDLVTMGEWFRGKGIQVRPRREDLPHGHPDEHHQREYPYDDEKSWDEAYNIQAPEQNAEGKKVNWSPKDKGSQRFESVEVTGGDDAHSEGRIAKKAVEMLGKLKRGIRSSCSRVYPAACSVGRPGGVFPGIYDRYKMVAPVVQDDDLDDVRRSSRGYKANDTTYGVTPELHKGLLQAYYASVSYMDRQVGRVLKALEEEGLAKETIVVFSSDHGYLLVASITTPEAAPFRRVDPGAVHYERALAQRTTWRGDPEGDGIGRCVPDHYGTYRDEGSRRTAGSEFGAVAQGYRILRVEEDRGFHD